MDGLRIDPCIPAEWEGFSVQRKFRGKNWEIGVHNPQHVQKGVVRVTVDGNLIDGNLVPADLPGGAHVVEAWMG